MSKKLIATIIKISILCLLWAITILAGVVALWVPPFALLAIVFGALATIASGVVGFDLMLDLNKYAESQERSRC